ncbi:MAG TPA: endonuclease, partial [Metabacillus sp.]|nr:endonuclease [Metabacillus sp.]
GKTGTSLKTALHNIIDDHTEISYSNVWEALRNTDEDPNNHNNVILLYTGRSQSKTSNGTSIDSWNREHVWAKSHGDFGTTMGAGTDLHHLRPTDVTVNSSRGNKDFDNGGTAQKEAPATYADSDSWEPRDEVKGDVARMIFYMAVRYEGDNGELDLEVSETVNNGYAPLHGKLSTLLQWHQQDPVDDFERNRNEIIYQEYQHNRNPFIDHPEWAEAIW